MLLRGPYSIKQYTDPMKTLSKPNGIFHKNRTKNSKFFMALQKTLNNQSNLQKENKLLKASCYLISNYITKTSN